MWAVMANTIRTTGFQALIKALVEGRHAKGITQCDLAAKLGCLPATVANIDGGQRRIDVMACQRDPCWPSVSSTSRTARSRTSGENLFVVLLMMLHLTQELGPRANPVRFTVPFMRLLLVIPCFPAPALTSLCALPSFTVMSIFAPLDCRFRINAGSLLTRSLPRAEAVID